MEKNVGLRFYEAPVEIVVCSIVHCRFRFRLRWHVKARPDLHLYTTAMASCGIGCFNDHSSVLRPAVPVNQPGCLSPKTLSEVMA
jgi:hypothetical protein